MEPAGPYLHRPGAPLSEHISYIGYWKHDGAAPHRSTALPRGAVTIVIELSEREWVDFAAVDSPPAQVPAAFVAGTGTTSYVTRIAPGQTVMTVQLVCPGHPGRRHRRTARLLRRRTQGRPVTCTEPVVIEPVSRTFAR